MNKGVDHFTAIAQLIVTVLWIVGVFGLLVLDARGLFTKPLPTEGLLAATGVVLYFWFNRQRNQDDPGTGDKKAAVTTQEEQKA